jgi:C-terminal processing protease CtpA/Prc
LTCSGLVEATDPNEGCSLQGSTTAPQVTVPLLLLVDRRTASASEYLVVRLKDHAGVRVIGEHTAGAGCGMTNGGVPITLPHIGLRVELPDCARLRHDGRNEREGVEVDVALGPHPETGWPPDVLRRALSDVQLR